MKYIAISVMLIIMSNTAFAQLDSTKIQETNRDSSQQSTGSIYLKESIVPVGLVASGLTIMAIPNLKVNIQNHLNWNNQQSPHYINLGDNYIRYIPSVAAYTLSAIGMKSKHSFLDRSLRLVTSYVISDFIVNTTKKTALEMRPDGRERTSMPSQHTAIAFVGATFLDHELGYISPWISIGGYGLASWVAYCRVARNAHYMNDVLIGAAVGMLSTHATYWAFDGIEKLCKKKKIVISPMIGFNEAGVSAYMEF